VDQIIHAAPGPGLKALAEPGQPLVRALEHLGRTVEPVHGVHGEAVEDVFGQQPFSTAQLDDCV
jgi:hypothetical protein